MDKRDSLDDSQLPISEEICLEPKIEFNATSYAVLECEQRIDVIIKRYGPTDVDVRFRCIHLFSYSFMHVYATIQCDTT
jgi:hypothetical protein